MLRELLPSNGQGGEEQLLTCCLVVVITLAGLAGVGVYKLAVWLFS